jgi:SAM-dependent methyltransferase
LDDIKAEIERLAPWHFSILIKGYSTGDSPVEITHPKLVELRHAGAFQRRHYSKVLDLGSNAGQFAFWFVDNTNSEVDAIEFHPRYFEQLKFATEHKGYSNKVKPIFKDVCEGSFGSNHYDLVLCLGLLHHLPEACQLKILRESRKAMIAGGEIVVQAHSELDLNQLLILAGFTNIRRLSTNWNDRHAFEAQKDPMKLHDN